MGRDVSSQIPWLNHEKVLRSEEAWAMAALMQSLKMKTNGDYTFPTLRRFKETPRL
jgi:hypothetical protein